MLAPKKVKFRKMMKGRMRGKAYRGGSITLGKKAGLALIQCSTGVSRHVTATGGAGIERV